MNVFLAVELVTALLAGFVLGRVWEIRQRIVLAEPIDERSRPVEIRAAKVAQQVPSRDSDRLAALDREMRELIRGVAMKGRRSNTTDGRTGPVDTSTYGRNL